MALLDTASLIVTPNGYKASKLYSIVPTDGTGDMAFSRTGNTATRVNSSGLIEGVNANIPRLDYLGSTCPKLLLEPQRTNLALRSEEIDNATWLKTEVTISGNLIVSPSGSTNADKIIESTSNALHFTYQNIGLSNSTNYSFSCFLKSGERTKGTLRLGYITNFDDDFDLTTGLATYGTLTNYGNGWFRYVRNFTTLLAGGTFFSMLILRNNSGLQTYTGDGSSGLYLWGAQVELGTFATSYIPTTTASVTRNADACSKTGISSLLNTSQGTIYLKGNFGYGISTLYILDITDGSDANKIQIVYLGNSVIRFRIQLTSGISNVDYTMPNPLTTFTLVGRYSASEVSFFVNGVLISQTTGRTSSGTLSAIAFGQWYSANTTANISAFAFWKTALTNSECLTLSQS